MQRYNNNNNRDIQILKFYGLSMLFFMIGLPILCLGYVSSKPPFNPSKYIKVNSTITSAYSATFYYNNEIMNCRYLTEFDTDCISDYMCKKKREYYYPINTKIILLYSQSSGYCRTEQFTTNLTYIGIIFMSLYIFSCIGICINIVLYTTRQESSYESILDNSHENKYIKIYDTLECSICTVMFNDDKFILKKCGHIYHKKCIDEWFNKKNTCPICIESQNIV